MVQWNKNLPADAEDMRSISGPKIPHVSEQLSLCITTTAPTLYSPEVARAELVSPNYWNPHTLEPGLHNKKRHNEECMCRNDESPRLATTTESLRIATRTQCNQQQTNNQKKIDGIQKPV